MPYLVVRTNQPIDKPEALMKKTSSLLSGKLGKPESYIMVSVEAQKDLIFAGSADPAAYVELKSIGLTDSHTKELSRSVCEFLGEELGIPAGRIYVEFSGVPGAMWGWDSGTFG